MAKKEFDRVDDGVNAVFKMGFTEMYCLRHGGVNCIKKRGHSISMVHVEDIYGTGNITFNGMSFEDWKETL